MAAEDRNPCRGIQALIRRYRRRFRKPENTNHYSPEDYREAERRFIRFCLMGRDK